MATPTVYVICDQNCKFESMTKEQILAAIVQAVNEGTISDIDTGFVQTIKTINGTPLRFFVGEQSVYDALEDEQKENLFAIITNDTTRDGIVSAIETLQEDMQSLTNRLDKTVEDIENGNIVAGSAKVAETAAVAWRLIDVAPCSNRIIQTGLYAVNFKRGDSENTYYTVMLSINDLTKYFAVTTRGVDNTYNQCYYSPTDKNIKVLADGGATTATIESIHLIAEYV